jgi:hypothetical protein
MPDGTGNREFAPHEDRIRPAGYVREHVGAEVARRADHVWEAHEEGGPLEYIRYSPLGNGHAAYRPAEYESAQKGAHETLHGFLWAELDQRRLAERLACLSVANSRITHRIHRP